MIFVLNYIKIITEEGAELKLFVVSDIHGYYDILIEYLRKAGFEDNNPSQLLICCGDYWDRGKQPVEVMNYLMSLTNVILVRGNHEDLMIEMLKRGTPLRHDISNGTQTTFLQLSSEIKNPVKSLEREVENYIKPFYDKMLDFYETRNYIFVHGWIPVKEKFENNTSLHTIKEVYDPDWRNASEVEWSDSRWYNGMKLAREGIIEPNKTIVCGHWHCAWGYQRDLLIRGSLKDLKEFQNNPTWLPYKDTGIIAIDRCTAATKEMNILILEDELL